MGFSLESRKDWDAAKLSCASPGTKDGPTRDGRATGRKAGLPGRRAAYLTEGRGLPGRARAVPGRRRAHPGRSGGPTGTEGRAYPGWKGGAYLGRKGRPTWTKGGAYPGRKGRAYPGRKGGGLPGTEGRGLPGRSGGAYLTEGEAGSPGTVGLVKRGGPDRAVTIHWANRSFSSRVLPLASASLQ